MAADLARNGQMENRQFAKSQNPCYPRADQTSVGNWSHCFHRNRSAVLGICIKDLDVVEIHCILPT